MSQIVATCSVCNNAENTGVPARGTPRLNNATHARLSDAGLRNVYILLADALETLKIKLNVSVIFFIPLLCGCVKRWILFAAQMQ